jgi:hypothetical protein
VGRSVGALATEPHLTRAMTVRRPGISHAVAPDFPRICRSERLYDLPEIRNLADFIHGQPEAKPQTLAVMTERTPPKGRGQNPGIRRCLSFAHRVIRSIFACAAVGQGGQRPGGGPQAGTGNAGEGPGTGGTVGRRRVRTGLRRGRKRGASVATPPQRSTDRSEPSFKTSAKPSRSAEGISSD